MLTTLIRSFRFAIAGVIHGLRTQRNLRFHAAATVGVLGLGLIQNIADWKWCAALGCIGLVWVAELLNSAIEVLCDRVTPEHDEAIRHIKDLAAGAVLVAAVISLIVALLIFL